MLVIAGDCKIHAPPGSALVCAFSKVATDGSFRTIPFADTVAAVVARKLAVGRRNDRIDVIAPARMARPADVSRRRDTVSG
jgi:hypothetical protein